MGSLAQALSCRCALTLEKVALSPAEPATVVTDARLLLYPDDTQGKTQCGLCLQFVPEAAPLPSPLRHLWCQAPRTDDADARSALQPFFALVTLVPHESCRVS